MIKFFKVYNKSKIAHEGKTSVQILPPVWKNNCTQVAFQWIFAAGKWLLIDMACWQPFLPSFNNILQVH